MYFGRFARCLYVLVFCHVLVPKIINQMFVQSELDDNGRRKHTGGRLHRYTTVANNWMIAQGKSAGFGRLCYFHFALNLVTSFIFITLP